MDEVTSEQHEDSTWASSERAKVDAVDQARAYDAIFRRVVDPQQQLGRYVVLDVLGQGGMGVVLRAYDRQLDRPVALKVLHPDIEDRHAQRLHREAQAMAKLSHPHVVQVYEVGHVEGRMFVAMELVQGQTIRAWMKQQPGWRAVVKVFVQLGSGLAAAHERGLVHRDFKPGNAVIDGEGRARVLDFGLARRDDDADDRMDDVSLELDREPTGALEPVALEPVALETSLTKTGAVIGTPAYMSPEQMKGLEADARSDQFSFCVALYEALYGERPFEGNSMMALIVSVQRGEVRPAPKGRKVPTALRRVLLRGLAIEPEQRWPSMDALLEALRRLSAPVRRRRLVLAVAGGLVTIGGGLATTQTLDWVSRCSGARTQLAGVWDRERRQELKAAILGTGVSYASGTWERLEPRLDAYADAWVAEHTETCKATRVRHEQSEADMSLRMSCLHERRRHLRMTVDELRRADATVVRNAVRAAASLPGLERCRDLDVLRAEVPPPEDPVVAQQVEALDELLLEAKAKQGAGRYEEGSEAVGEVVAKAIALEYEPLMARAWLRQGALRADGGDYEGAAEALSLAYDAALALGMTDEAAAASSGLLLILGGQLGRPEEALHWDRHAEALSRATDTDEARAAYLNGMGVVVGQRGEHDRARDFYERALALKEKALGPEHPDVADTLGNLGIAALSQGKPEEARGFHERALAIKEKALGPEHPDVAISLNNLGAVASSQGKHARAREFQERALEIKEKALGLDHPSVANTLANLGIAAHSRGEYQEARVLFERALAIREKALGPEHPDVASSLNNLGIAVESLGEHEQALAFHERALAIREKVLGADHPDLSSSLLSMGNVAQAQHQYERAREFYERALAIEEKAQGPDHPSTGIALTNLGDVALAQGDHERARESYERALACFENALGPEHPLVAHPLMGIGKWLIAVERPADALPALERALAIRTTGEVQPKSLAATRFALARAAWLAPADRGGDQARARALAEQARDGYAAAGEGEQESVTEVQAWLDEHRLP